MVTFNQVTFVGNVGSDVDMHTAGTGKNYTRFRLAVDSFSSKDNDTPPLWLSVVAWDKLAEQVEKVVRKGSLVLVSGRLAISTYTDKEQKERTSVDVIAHTVQALSLSNKKAESQVSDEEPEAA